MTGPGTKLRSYYRGMTVRCKASPSKTMFFEVFLTAGIVDVFNLQVQLGSTLSNHFDQGT
jgi:hypothetical protein